MVPEGFGTLHLPDAPCTAETASLMAWESNPAVPVAVLVAVLLFIFNLKDYIRLLPTVFACTGRAKPNIALEHNIHTFKERNITALTLLIPFVLLVHKYGMYKPSFLEDLPPVWSLLSGFGAVAAFLAVRYLFYPLRPYRLHGDESKAAHNVLYTCFIALVTIMVATAAGMSIFKASTNSVRAVLLIETAVFYFLSIIRSGQILSLHCSALSTFLYLCALEILPAALTVVSALVF